MTDTLAPGLTAGTWDIDPAHTEVTFNIRHLMTTVRGSFTKFSGRIAVADDPLDSTASAEIALDSIDTRNADRDAHVRSSEILDVENNPTIDFQAIAVSPARVGRRARQPRYNVDGELTIRGVTRPVRLLTEYHGIGTDAAGDTRAGFTATTRILRSDFGIQFNVPLGGDRMLLGDEIEIGLEVQAVLAS